MLYNKLAYAVAFSTGALAATATTGSTGGSGLTLDADAVQTGSFSTGLDSIGAEAGEAASQTSENNFINFCAGKTLTNGLQIVTGSCNGIVMGDIPAKTNMVSSIITFPQTGSVIPSDTTFTITVQMSNIVAGFFTDADATYYAGPQFLQDGNVVGHTHVTVQDLGTNLNPTVALDPTQFAFFKGINNAGNGEGLLSANVTGGLPAGNYRVCTMAAAANHQPVLMPVAQRGTPDDCTKFVVSGDGTTINADANNGSGGLAAAAAASEAVVGATNSAFAASVISAESAAAVAATATSASSAATAVTTTSAADNGSKDSKGGKGGKGSDATSSSVAAADTTAADLKGAGNGAKAVGGETAISSSSTSCSPVVTSTPAAAKHSFPHKQRFARRQFVA